MVQPLTNRVNGTTLQRGDTLAPQMEIKLSIIIFFSNHAAYVGDWVRSVQFRSDEVIHSRSSY